MVEKKSKDSSLVSSSSLNAGTSSTPTTLFYNEAAMRNNFAILEYCKTCQSAASGMVSGILGLNGAYGFLFYFICVLIQAVCWEYKAGFKWNTFFVNRSLSVSHSLINGLFTYVLFWVFIYGVVHVY